MRYTTEVQALEPRYRQRNNLGRGERITLKEIKCSIKSRKDKSDRPPKTYEFTFNVGDDGIVKLGKVERPREDRCRLYASALIRTLPVAESAVREWINHEDPANLALQQTYARLEMNEQDECPPITNEKEVDNE